MTTFNFGGVSQASGSATVTFTVGTSTANGDTLVVAVSVSAGASVPQTVGDTQGNIYTLRDSEAISLPYLYAYECQNANPLTASTDVITIILSGTTSAVDAIGIDVPSFPNGIDVDVKATGTSSSASKATGTLAQGGETVVAMESHLNAGGSPTWSGGATSLGTQHSGSTQYLSAAYDAVTATTSVTPSASIASTTWNCIVLSYPNAPVTVVTTVSGAIQNQAYSQTLEASGGLGTYTWTLTGSLPAGLSLASGAISGTPTGAAGAYTFTVTATDSGGNSGSQVQTIVIEALGTTSTGTILYDNQLSLNDSGCGTGPGTWTADSNANSPFNITTFYLDGTSCIGWTAAADGDTSIHTGFYNCTASKGYLFSGFLLSSGGDPCQIGVEWYSSGGSLLSTTLSNAFSAGAQVTWQPVQLAATSPAGAVKLKVVAYVMTANKGDLEMLDLFWMSGPCKAQVLVDWTNDPYVSFGQANLAGSAFMDVSPWVRIDQSITLSRGRQDAVNDIPSGSANFSLQNDTGVFTAKKASALVSAAGGEVTVGRRVQINLTDETGAWNTRFDGSLIEIDYAGDNTGNTNLVNVNASDVLSFLTNQDTLDCWTREQIKVDTPMYTWALDDTGNTGNAGSAVESSGGNGPPMRTFNKDSTGNAAIAWGDSTAGVEILADAVSLTHPDGSEYWSAGSYTPSSPLRGLDSGTFGPYSTPLQSIFLTPVFSTQTSLGQNSYIGNTGYCLFTELGAANVLSPNADGEDFSMEIWFSMDTTGNVQEAPLSLISGTPTTAMAAATKIGPYIQLGLGSSRNPVNLVAGMFFNSTTSMNYEIVNYNQPPAFRYNTWGTAATVLASASTPFVPDRIPVMNGNNVQIAGGSLVHHLVLVCAGASGGGEVTFWLDGMEGGSVQLEAGQIFDTIYIGAAMGGQGGHFGNLSLCSLYPFQLSPTQITNHCMLGQYGMWEQSTDNAIYTLGQFANIPSFWSLLGSSNNGLTLCDYQDITGSNALTNMQTYEQTELGLLYVNAAGQLVYHTRDWRMGYGAPDLLLPPDTYDASMGMQLMTQFMANEVAFSTETYQTGATFTNSESQAKYGPYVASSGSSATELPYITWSRAYSLLGLPNLSQWPDPYLTDGAAWLCNTRSDPWMLPGSLTIDILATDAPAGCPTISQWYAIDIDNMIKPTGTQPASWQDAGGTNTANEWFVEGINETISDSQHVLVLYVSPAETQRAWKMGDSTYGVLGKTARIGISAVDINTVYVQAKDVQHDAGPPYVPPSITALGAGTLNNPAGNGHGFVGATDMRGLWSNLAQVISPPTLVVSATQNAQGISSGATTTPELVWDTIYIDTANGMGIVGGWPNWYVVTVPGFYEIDASVIGFASGTGTAGSIQSWICVAEEGAQGLASGLSTPLSGSLYVCPIGEQQPLNYNNDNPVMAPTTTLYLGVGDMITVCCQQGRGSAYNLAFSFAAGSMLSLRWISNSEYADKCRNNTSISSGGTVTDVQAFTPQTFAWTNTGSVSYLGSPSNKKNPGSNQRLLSNGSIRQGESPKNTLQTGSQYGGFQMPHSSILSALTGSTIMAASITAHCNSGTASKTTKNPQMLLGWTSASAFGGLDYKFDNTGDNPDLTTLQFESGQTSTVSIPASLVQPFVSSSAVAFTVGNNSTTNEAYYGEWNGSIGQISLIVTAIL